MHSQYYGKVLMPHYQNHTKQVASRKHKIVKLNERYNYNQKDCYSSYFRDLFSLKELLIKIVQHSNTKH